MKRMAGRAGRVLELETQSLRKKLWRLQICTRGQSSSQQVVNPQRMGYIPYSNWDIRFYMISSYLRPAHQSITNVMCDVYIYISLSFLFDLWLRLSEAKVGDVSNTKQLLIYTSLHILIMKVCMSLFTEDKCLYH